jgi:hypothetical protein
MTYKQVICFIQNHRFNGPDCRGVDFSRIQTDKINSNSSRFSEYLDAPARIPSTFDIAGQDRYFLHCP